MTDPITPKQLAESTPWANRMYAPMNPVCYGRRPACCVHDGRTVAVVQVSRGRVETLAAVWRDAPDAPARAAVLPADGPGRYQPAVASDGDRLVVAWNEQTDPGWAIRWAELDLTAGAFGEVRTLHACTGFCTPPALSVCGGNLHAAWSARLDGRFRVCLAAWSDATEVRPISPPDTDAFRPAVVADGPGLLAAWDEGLRADRQVVLARCDDGRTAREIARLGNPGERHLGPRLLACNEGGALVAWLVLRTVVDEELGIVDHYPAVHVAAIAGERVEVLRDPARTDDDRIVADLREGQLPAERYRCYHGLRQNPQWACDGRGGAWLCWEQRVEAENSESTGYLIARAWDGGQWSDPVRLHGGGFGYAVADRADEVGLRTAHFVPGAGGLEFLATPSLPVSPGEAIIEMPARWNRWRVRQPELPTKPTRTIDHNGTSYRLFWADTHCHSALCPDAEGEPDDLLRFARDVAGLDAVCLMDNGWYPPKSLTTPEWGQHRALAEHYTEAGRFVAFSGYEFSWHDRDATPVHRHRTIFFPRGGPLLRRIDPATPDPASLFDHLARTDGYSYMHHCEYDILDDRFDIAAEVCSSWRVCIEENDCTRSHLRAGRRVGFIGSSDSHRMVPGLGGALTGILATELTPEAILDAYWNRRLIATTGQFVFVDFRVNGALPGMETTCSRSVVVTVDLEASVPVESVRVMRDAEPVHAWRPGETTFQADWQDTAAEAGEHSYYLRVRLAGEPSFNDPDTPERKLARPFGTTGRYAHNLARARGPFAWASPVRVTIF